MTKMVALGSSRAALEPGALVGERFEIAEPVASGGMGAVYRAQDRQTGGLVALKVALGGSDPTYVARFEREAHALAQLDHPHIVGYVGNGQMPDGVPYLAMEWLDGCDLLTRIRREPLDEAQTLTVAKKLCSALAVSHDHGIVHRDLKPGNIFLVDEDPERPCIIDFGLVRIASIPEPLTVTGTLVGTPAYIAPEQASHEKTPGECADLYSLGAVLFSCLTGRPPFTGQQLLAVLTKVLLEPAPRVRDIRPTVSSALDGLIGRLLSKKPAKRPQSAGELLDLLLAFDRVPRAVEARRTAPIPVEALSHRENRFFSVLVVERAEGTDKRKLVQAISREATSAGGQVHRMANGAIVAVFTTESAPAEMATAAARAALVVHREHPRVAMTVATGRGTLDERAPVGEVIDRAVAMLFHYEETVESQPGAAEVVVDDVTAGLIERRFQLHAMSGGSYALGGESRGFHAIHQLLGRETPFVGRRRELATLQAILDECIAESAPRAVLVVGAEGTGKSRIVHELLRRLDRTGEPSTGRESGHRVGGADRRALAVWAAHGDPGLAGASFSLLGQILRHAMGVSPTQSVDERRARIRAHVRTHFSSDEARRVAAFLGEIIATPFPADGLVQLEEARNDPRLMNDQMRKAWEDWLEAHCRDQPILLVLDDLHWGDLPTVRYIEAAMRNLRRSPFMVLALASPTVHDKLGDLWRDRDVEQIPLRPLSKRACHRLARHVLSEDVEDARIEALVEHCAGNPFYLEELLRNATRSPDAELPDTIVATASRRLREQSSKERRLLRAASTFGRRFWLEGVAALLGEDFDSVQAALDILCERELVVRDRQSRFPGFEAYSFRHAVLREAAYASFTREDQLRAHHGAACWLEGIGENEPMVLAEHYYRGAVLDSAEPWYRRAAQNALDAGDLQAVIDRAEMAVACGAKGGDLGASRLLQAEAHNWRTEHESALQRAREAMEEIAAGSDDWAHAAHQLCWASYGVAQVAGVESTARALVAHVPQTPSDGYLAALSLCGGYAAALELRRVAAESETLVAEHIARRSPGLLLRGIVARVNASRASFDGHWGDTAAFMMEAVEVWSELGNERSACNDEVNLGVALCQLGEYEESLSVLQSCRDRARRVGSTVAIFCTSALAMSRARNGDLDEARALFNALASDQPGKYLEAMSYVYRGWFAGLEGQPARAGELASRAIELADRDAFPQVQAFAAAVRARSLLELGDAEQALGEATTGMKALESLGQLDEGDMYLRLAHAEALYATGATERALGAIRAAAEELERRANAISNPHWRASFLERVSENARIRELAESWTQPASA